MQPDRKPARSAISSPKVGMDAYGIATRSDPGSSLLPVHGVPCGAIDPRISPDKREKKEFTNTVGIIDACKPFQWKDQFPLTNEFSKD